MKNILAIISVLIISSVFSQKDTIRYYSLEELKTASIDSVIAIDLKKMNLTQLPEVLFQFKNLQYLNLSKNKLTDINGVENFPHLRYLNVEKNKLEYFPVSICQLIEIETLILNRNNFETIPPCIEQCQKLKVIDLWYTAVTSLPNEMIRIKTLESIDLTGVQINHAGQDRLKNMFPTVKLILSPPCNCMY